MPTQLDFSFEYLYKDEPDGILLPTALTYGGATALTYACVDPGSAFCVFSREIGDELGLEIESGFPKRMGSLTGALDTFGHEIVLQTLEVSFPSVVYFAKYHGLQRNLLGRTGWLDRLRLALIHHDNLLYYDDYDR